MDHIYILPYDFDLQLINKQNNFQISTIVTNITSWAGGVRGVTVNAK